MRIYNTLTEKKERLLKRGTTHLFVCGPTVYDYAHIGHARTYLAFDIIVRYLRSQGWRVRYIQNITDVDDKIIKRAKQKKQSPFKVARFFEKAHYEDMQKLGITSVDKYARASDVIPEIITQITTLLNKGFAYCTSSGVYFEVRKFKEYGKLSKQNIDALKAGVRIEPDEEKKDVLDFALWKFSKTKATLPNKKRKKPVLIDGEPVWWSPWGWGRPGWHIEDTAISEKYFGPQYEIHGGAEELKFPHHEAEIAQQEAASGKKPFVKIWLHTGVLTVQGEKMSKSLGNFITIRDFLKNHTPNALRWLALTHNYRSRFDYTEDVVNEAEQSLNSLRVFLEKMHFLRRTKCQTRPRKHPLNIAREIRKAEQLFYRAMEDDFNTSRAVAALFTYINTVQPHIWTLTKQEAQTSEQHIASLLAAFGIIFDTPSFPTELKQILKEREKYRVHQQFIQADRLRKKLKRVGYEVEDTPLGPFVRKS